MRESGGAAVTSDDDLCSYWDWFDVKTVIALEKGECVRAHCARCTGHGPCGSPAVIFDLDPNVPPLCPPIGNTSAQQFDHFLIVIAIAQIRRFRDAKQNIIDKLSIGVSRAAFSFVRARAQYKVLVLPT